MGLLEQSNLCVVHIKRVTVMLKIFNWHEELGGILKFSGVCLIDGFIFLTCLRYSFVLNIIL